MADVLEAMGFPKEWCERALRSSSGVEPAVELLLQWQADGGVPPAAGDPPMLPVLSSPPRQSISVASASTVTNSVSQAAGLDAVVPDAGGVEQNRHPNAAERLQKVQEEESEKKKARKNMLEDNANGRWRSQLAPAPVDASGLVSSGNMKSTPVELHIRCSGYPTMKGTFSAGTTLKEVRDFVVQELRRAPLQQPAEMPSSVGTSRQARRASRSSGVFAGPPSDRLTQRARKTSRYADPSSNARAPRDLAGGNVYFLIPVPRTVFDTEASMETTLVDANLFPRGILTVQFQTKEEPSTSAQVNNPHEYNGPSQEGVQRRQAHGPGAQPSGDNHISRRVEDVVKREQRLKATLDRYGSGQGSERESIGMGAVSMLAPIVTPLASASSKFVAHGREERTLEVDGERVRHRELALQAAAKRMTEAAEIFREGFMSNEGEAGAEFSSPTDGQPVPSMTSDGEARFISENQDLKGKQVADCGPSSRTNQPAEVQVQDVGSNIVGPGVRGSRARMPLPSPSPSRPEKLQRTDEVTSTTSAGANHNTSFFASGHALERASRREVEEASPSERWNRGSPGSGSPSVSELRIRLEDGSVLRQIFPAYTTLQSVCEFAIPGRFSTAEYGLILPMPGSHFFEGEALNTTLQEVGLVPRGVVHLQKVASRGLVTQGRRRARHIMRYIQSDNEPEPELEQLWQDFSRHMNTNLTYEELIELEDSIGRVNVGVPEATIANLPTHTVSRSAGDICIVCLSEMVEGEEVMLLPCLHTFHPACIRQWLLQSTCCPTCKHYIT